MSDIRPVSEPTERSCGEMLTETTCIRLAGHLPPHSAERRMAPLLDERDAAVAEVERLRESHRAVEVALENSQREVRQLREAGDGLAAIGREVQEGRAEPANSAPRSTTGGPSMPHRYDWREAMERYPELVAEVERLREELRVADEDSDHFEQKTHEALAWATRGNWIPTPAEVDLARVLLGLDPLNAS
jgi:hypothetical protein